MQKSKEETSTITQTKHNASQGSRNYIHQPIMHENTMFSIFIRGTTFSKLKAWLTQGHGAFIK